MEDEVQQGEVLKKQKVVSGVESQTIGVGSVHKRRVFVRGVVE